MNKILYRYEISYSSEDGPTSIMLREFPVIRETEKTYFIHTFYGYREKRVPKTAHNAYAFESKDDAKQHFIRRTNKRIGWFEYWIKECNKGLKLIEEKK